MTHLSWVALCGMAHSFTELDKAVVHVIRLVIFLWLFSVCLLSDEAHGSFLMRKTEEMKPKQKQHPVVDVTGDRSKV